MWFKKKLAEYYTISGALLLLLLFSLSRFQLPFYTNTIFPLFAVITAPFCYKGLSRFGTTYRLISLWIYIIALTLVILVIHYFSKPGHTVPFIIDCILFGLAGTMIMVKVRKPHLKAFFLTCAAALFANLYLNTVFYPIVASYNGQIKAADYINRDTFDNYHIYSLKFENNIFQFYSKRPVDYIPLDSFKEFKPPAGSVFYVNHKSMDFLRQSHADFKVIKTFQNYPQEIILPSFINLSTRNKVLDSVYLVTK